MNILPNYKLHGEKKNYSLFLTFSLSYRFPGMKRIRSYTIANGRSYTIFRDFQFDHKTTEVKHRHEYTYLCF